MGNPVYEGNACVTFISYSGLKIQNGIFVRSIEPAGFFVHVKAVVIQSKATFPAFKQITHIFFVINDA
jgi:hypothetical protein